MSKIEAFVESVCLSFKKEVIKKLVFSRPKNSEILKVSARLVSHRGRNILAFEYSLPGNTVSHKNVGEAELESFISELISSYSQANLITTVGEVEWKVSKSGKEAILGADKLKRKLEGENIGFEAAIESLDNKKNYLLSGNEDFLIKLGISDKTGRVHDKRQGKYRQICRFLEIVEDIYSELPGDGEITVYDLCCGKSYLSFAVYYYLTERKGREVRMLGIDLKRDCINWCSELAISLGYSGMTFVTDDVRNTPKGVAPDMVISLHACDIATDIVINRAMELGAKVILSTPCCHRHINDKIAKGPLSFVTNYPHLRNKLGDVLTDAIRVARLEAEGYSVAALELVDPDDTPKNTLIKAIKRGTGSDKKKARYEEILDFVLGENKGEYLKDI
ncbi:MAG: SAM-dependent methyltransferase [Clostridia bacterium]|nr:SAM-dependent methyltransferase [Clostridia bacterium]